MFLQCNWHTRVEATNCLQVLSIGEELKAEMSMQAVRCYSEALEADSTLAAAYNNRALAHLKLGNLADAEADCGYVLRLEPRNVKAFLRRGSAR